MMKILLIKDIPSLRHRFIQDQHELLVAEDHVDWRMYSDVDLVFTDRSAGIWYAAQSAMFGIRPKFALVCKHNTQDNDRDLELLGSMIHHNIDANSTIPFDLEWYATQQIQALLFYQPLDVNFVAQVCYEALS